MVGMALPASAATKTTKAGPAATTTSQEVAGDNETVVVHVRDAAAGEIDIFRGTSHTKLHDRALAAHLVRASR
jgi:hypothetical protein